MAFEMDVGDIVAKQYVSSSIIAYKVTVKQIKTEVIRKRDWQKGAGEDDNYGYTPLALFEGREEVVIYDQIIPAGQFDLVPIIAAANRNQKSGEEKQCERDL